MAFPANLQREVEAIQASSVPVNQQADSICKLLVQHGFAQHHQALTPACMLVHPSNRAGSMLSFHDAWSKGKQMLHVGMKKPLLEGSPHFVQQPHHCFPEMLAAWIPTPRQWTSIGCSQIRPMLGLDYPRVVLACHKP